MVVGLAAQQSRSDSSFGPGALGREGGRKDWKLLGAREGDSAWQERTAEWCDQCKYCPLLHDWKSYI